MIAVINDVSFQYPYKTKERAVEMMHQFLDICRQIEKEEITNIEEIRTGMIDTQTEIAPNYRLIQLIQEFKAREERSFLLSILTNRGTYKIENTNVCKIDGKDSFICAQARDNFLISLLSHHLFAGPVLMGVIGQEAFELRNISQNEHIEFYRNELGIRRYIANSKKHKYDKENFYGRGKVGSRMDLRDEEAQEMLNKAIYIKGRLYAKKNGCYYASQNEGDVVYHGYRADDLGDDIKRQLDKHFS